MHSSAFSRLNICCPYSAFVGAIGMGLMFFLISMEACSQKQIQASDRVRTYLKIESGVELTDENIRNAVLKLVPVGTAVTDIFERMSKTGLGPGHCAPGEIDGTAFSGLPYCEFRSSEDACGDKYVNYNIYFVLAKKPEIKNLFETGATSLKDIKVNRWTRPCR